MDARASQRWIQENECAAFGKSFTVECVESAWIADTVGGASTKVYEVPEL